MTRRARSKQRGSGGVPDWAWGLGLGLIVVIAVGGFFLITNSSGGGGSCNRELSPLGASEISQNAFDDKDATISGLLALLNGGGREDAESDFYAGGMHNFTHNIDAPVRQKDAALAKELCELVLVVESDFVGAPASQIASGIEQMRELIRDSAEALGYDRPG